MANQSNFPAVLDGTPTDKNPGDIVPSADWNKYLDGIDQLEQKVGVNSSPVSGSLDYKLEHHHTQHENGGNGKILVTGLSGLLADDQHVLDSEVLTAMPFIDSRSYGTLELANTAAYNAGKLLVIAQNYTLTGNTTLTAAVKVVKGSGFTKASTYTLIINGPFEAGLYQVFSGFSAGNVTFGAGSVKEVYPQWWGTGDVAINSAFSALTSGRTWKEKVKFIGSFTISSSVLIPSFTEVDLIQAYISATATPFLLSNTDGSAPSHDVNIIGGHLKGGQGAYHGIWGKGGIYNILTSEVNISMFGTGLQQGVYLRGNNITVQNCKFDHIGGVPILCGRDSGDTFSAHSIHVINNYIDVYSGEDCICFDYVERGSMVYNYVLANHIASKFKLFGNCKGCTVAYNKIYDSTSGGIIQFAVENGMPEDCDILFNLVGNPSTVSGTRGIYVGGNATYKAIRTKIFGNSLINVDIGISLPYTSYTRIFDNNVVCITQVDVTGADNYLINRNLGLTNAP